ncbi:27575_t:CDS:1 [Dentiscutata erythropus]|uniref:27575_t:CDS:1 n=1 Tax=Dentiscutata erythropus TaxID=1348616 RepID=A0A9N8VAJ3_9GLOM|nr:27575_t:CDS:1 [Dentiscutata erythropus]
MRRLINNKKLIFVIVVVLVEFAYVCFWSLNIQIPHFNFTKQFINQNFNSTFLGFDHIYVINISSLPGTYERLKLIENKLNLNFEFFPAVSQFDNELLNEFNQSELSSSQKAYYFSHYKIYQSIAQHKYESALILEDDIDFEHNITSIMTEIYQTLSADWEILYLGHCSDWERNSDMYLSENNNNSPSTYKIFKSKRPYCTHAYAVSYAGALKLLQKLHNITTNPIDLELVNIIKSNEISSYTIVPPVISRWRFDKSTDLYPGRNTSNLFSLKNSTLHSLGLNYVLNNTLGFSHIYIINRVNRVDRRENFESVAKKLNLNFEFFTALPKDDKEALKELRLADNAGLMQTQIASYLSHYKIYQSVINNEYDTALILEDYIEFEPNIDTIITDTFKFLPSDWDLFYFGHCSDHEASGLFIDGQDSSAVYKLYRSRHPLCTHGYAISRAGAFKLIEMLIPASQAIDSELAELNFLGLINSYSIVPPAIVQWGSSSNPSSIASI